MSTILYARVSSGKQAEKELSIPAQLKALRRLASEHEWTVINEYQDVGSGRSMKERPGLVQALAEAMRNPSVTTLAVHRIDRLYRNTFQYLTLKGNLRLHGVRIVSVVEQIEDTPMGEFLEHIMAAQAEFYSANLSFEVKKGLKERLERGKWNGPLPLGYLKQRNGTVILDPARAHHIRKAFQSWSTGKVTSTKLAEELSADGFVGNTGQSVSGKQICAILHNPFYYGFMKTASGMFPGSHPSIISKEIFDRAQEVFNQKNGGGRPRSKLLFILAGKIQCPCCGGLLIGEEHVKPSGKRYRYYRCHLKGCGFSLQAPQIDDQVRTHLLSLDVPTKALPKLRQALREQKRRRGSQEKKRVQDLRADRKRLDKQIDELDLRYIRSLMAPEAHELERAELESACRVIDWQLAQADSGRAGKTDDATATMLDNATHISSWLKSTDPISQRRAIECLVEFVAVGTGDPVIHLKPEWNELLR